VIKKKVSTSTNMKKVFGCFTPSKQEPEDLDDYNLATLFRVEKVKRKIDTISLQVDLRPGLPIIFGSSKMRSL